MRRAFPLASLPGRLTAATLLCAGGLQPLAAQQPPAGNGRFTSAAERAQQESDKVFKRILLNGAIQRRVGANPPAEPPAAAKPPPPPRDKPVERPAAAEAHAPAVAAAPPRAPAVKPWPAAVPAARAASASAESAMPPAAAPVAEPPQADAAAEAELPPPISAPSSAPPLADEPLLVLQEAEPEFPIAIVRRQKKGNVVMRFVVQPDGTVAEIEVVKTTNPFLNPSAMQALSQWKFQPLKRAQVATVEMGFDLAQQLLE